MSNQKWIARFHPIVLGVSAGLLFFFNAVQQSEAQEEKSEISISIQCVTNGIPLKGNLNNENISERVSVEIKKIDISTTGDEELRFAYMKNAKIISEIVEYRATVVASGQSYIVLAYSNLIKNGLSNFIFSTLYEIDTTSMKVRRTTSTFPVWTSASQEMTCVKVGP
jgi:hypothetical protein